MTRTVTATRYVTPLREGGSLPGLVEADDDGLYVLKFRGAGQGVKALVAEQIAGLLGQSLGLPVPEIVLVDLDPAFGTAEGDPEVRELIERSGGINFGIDFLPGSLPFTPAAGPPPSPELAAEIVWFDAFITNVDRTPRNTNLLIWGRKLWMIDHGASLIVHHTWLEPAAAALRPFTAIKEHVLLPYAGSIAQADARLASRVTPEVVAEILSSVPDDWLDAEGRFGGAEGTRAAYADYLTRRLEARAAFVQEAERARAAS